MVRDAVFVTVDLLLQAQQRAQAGGLVGCLLKCGHAVLRFAQVLRVDQRRDQQAAAPQAEHGAGQYGADRGRVPADAACPRATGGCAQVLPHRQVGAAGGIVVQRGTRGPCRRIGRKEHAARAGAAAQARTRVRCQRRKPGRQGGSAVVQALGEQAAVAVGAVQADLPDSARGQGVADLQQAGFDVRAGGIGGELATDHGAGVRAHGIGEAGIEHVDRGGPAQRGGDAREQQAVGGAAAALAGQLGVGVQGEDHGIEGAAAAQAIELGEPGVVGLAVGGGGAPEQHGVVGDEPAGVGQLGQQGGDGAVVAGEQQPVVAVAPEGAVVGAQVLAQSIEDCTIRLASTFRCQYASLGGSRHFAFVVTQPSRQGLHCAPPSAQSIKRCKKGQHNSRAGDDGYPNAACFGGPYAERVTPDKY